MVLRRVFWALVFFGWVAGATLTYRLLGPWITGGILACLVLIALLPVLLTPHESSKDPSGEHPAVS